MRYGPVGSHYNSKKYLAMHNANISRGLKRYYRHKKGIYTEGELIADGIIYLTAVIAFVITIIILRRI